MAKIALNDAKLPKFKVINRKSWLPRTIVVIDLGPMPPFLVFNIEPYNILGIAQFILIVQPYKLLTAYANRGQRWEKFASVFIGHVIRHAQCLQTHSQWHHMGNRTHNSRTDSHRIFKLGEGVEHVTRHV